MLHFSCMCVAFSNLPPWYLYFFSGLFGAVFGSFSSVCVSRIPEGKSIVRPGSHCPKCDHVLSWYENIPILSFIALGAKCKKCGAKISVRYLVLELLCAGLAMLTWWAYPSPLEFFVYYCLLVVPLVIVTFIDLEHMIIPDGISITGIFVGFGAHMLLRSHQGYVSSAIDSGLGIIAGGGSLFLIAFLYEKIKKMEGLGGGDIKLMAALGAFYGWKAVIFIMFLSSVIGSIVGVGMMIALKKNSKYAIPFGPFIAAAGIVYLYFGDELLQWYASLLFR